MKDLVHGIKDKVVVIAGASSGIGEATGLYSMGQSKNLALRCFEWVAENGFHGSERINGSSTSTQRNWLASGLK